MKNMQEKIKITDFFNKNIIKILKEKIITIKIKKKPINENRID